MKFNREKFYDLYRQHFGALQQGQVNGLNVLLAGFEQMPEWKDLRHCAYALATAKHEAAHTFLPITEYGSNAYFQKYEGRADLGNTVQGDGLKFKGRGFVQITGRRNYSLFSNLLTINLLRDPTLALNPTIAFKIMTYGMHRGLFTGKKLADYINDEVCDYVNARKIINGLDKANTIAGYAQRFYQILRSAKTESLANLQDSEINLSPPPAEIPTAAAEGTQTADQITNISADTDAAKVEAAQDSPPVNIEKTEPTNFLGKMWKTIAGVFTGAVVVPSFLQNGFDYNTALAKILEIVLHNFKYILIATLGGLVVWFITKKINNFKLTALKANIDSDPAKRDIKFVEPYQMKLPTSFFGRVRYLVTGRSL